MTPPTVEAKNDSTLIQVVCRRAVHVHYTNGSQGGFNTSHQKTIRGLELLLDVSRPGINPFLRQSSFIAAPGNYDIPTP